MKTRKIEERLRKNCLLDWDRMGGLYYLPLKLRCVRHVRKFRTKRNIMIHKKFWRCYMYNIRILGKSHGKLGKHHYFLSWREPWNKFEDWDWFNARNFCRERCMDLVSFETAHEFQMFKEVMIAGMF